MFMRTFQKTSWNLERHSESKFWNIRNQEKYISKLQEHHSKTS